MVERRRVEAAGALGVKEAPEPADGALVALRAGGSFEARLPFGALQELVGFPDYDAQLARYGPEAGEDGD